MPREERERAEDELFGEDRDRAVREPSGDEQMCLNQLIIELGQYGVDVDRVQSKIQELKQVSRYMCCMGVDVTEIFSPPRVIKLAESYGLVPGLAFDLTTCDDDGQLWDFNVVERRQKAFDIIKRTKPLRVIGSPMCTIFKASKLEQRET